MKNSLGLCALSVILVIGTCHAPPQSVAKSSRVTSPPPTTDHPVVGEFKPATIVNPTGIGVPTASLLAFKDTSDSGGEYRGGAESIINVNYISSPPAEVASALHTNDGGYMLCGLGNHDNARTTTGPTARHYADG